MSLLLAACGYAPPRNASFFDYRVKPGDTLFAIAWRYDIDLSVLRQMNGLSRSSVIRPGQRLRLGHGGKGYTTQSQSRQKSTKEWRRPADKSRVKSSQRAKLKSKSWAPVKNVVWQWPTAGKVVRRFVASNITRKGIDIGGKQGDVIRAASSGKVVYSGNGLPGYGNLVIIKHNANFLSAYAHNKKNRVKEGQKVKAGQHIADLGKTGVDKPVLHFQIRRNGEPVNPVSFLPKRKH
ncbi:MAG: peptidoglycan DD-metalloendopeptidase family protein [Gammaproteobacteria bacterium]|nr:peptidoglycan DD-metalloendopeptidase family protein [Gammaproteobacteria bacterium]